jgi:hypothetical protein
LEKAINVGDKVKVWDEVRSMRDKNDIYAAFNSIATVTNVDHYPVMICENAKGRFPVRIEKLSEYIEPFKPKKQ